MVPGASEEARKRSTKTWACRVSVNRATGSSASGLIASGCRAPPRRAAARLPQCRENSGSSSAVISALPKATPAAAARTPRLPCSSSITVRMPAL